MKDIRGKEIKKGQSVAVAFAYYNSCCINLGEVIEVHTLKKDGTPRKQPCVEMDFGKDVDGDRIRHKLQQAQASRRVMIRGRG